MPYRVVATAFPRLANLHENGKRFAPFYVLVENDQGQHVAMVAIVEQPDTFNDRDLRSKLAQVVARKGTRLNFDRARGVFQRCRKDTYIGYL